jgi:CHASE1-domain containing sensor protein
MKPVERPALPAGSGLKSSGPCYDQSAHARGVRVTTKGLLRKAWRWRLLWLLVPTFVLGLAAAVGVSLWMSAIFEDEARVKFATRAGELTDQLDSRLRAYADVLYSVRGFMNHADAPVIRREEFHRFVDGLAIGERYPGLTNVSFSYHVPNAARAAFERRMRSEYEGLLPGTQEFEIKPAGERAEYEVVSYMEPLAPNILAVGLDLASDPARSDVVRRARDSGTLATSAGITLVHDGNAPASSVLLRLAVYENSGIPRTLESRREAFVGVAGVAIRSPLFRRSSASGCAWWSATSPDRMARRPKPSQGAAGFSTARRRFEATRPTLSHTKNTASSVTSTSATAAGYCASRRSTTPWRTRSIVRCRMRPQPASS